MSALIVSAVVRELPDGTHEIVVSDPFYKAKRQKAAKKWGAGCALTIRVEPEEEAWRHWDAGIALMFLAVVLFVMGAIW